MPVRDMSVSRFASIHRRKTSSSILSTCSSSVCNNIELNINRAMREYNIHPAKSCGLFIIFLQQTTNINLIFNTNSKVHFKDTGSRKFAKHFPLCVQECLKLTNQMMPSHYNRYRRPATTQTICQIYGGSGQTQQESVKLCRATDLQLVMAMTSIMYDSRSTVRYGRGIDNYDYISLA